ncbi:MAG: mechanosensitive ion channel [Thiobacillaceae bacterium]|nr:mechanosensitive ion channel [Thiobacillaceae bacterium]MCX7672272.1 mechanosensitive ion channel [Thiobacillaceae bacterium]MDW8322699.1 mechanosensitive ion channel [Burkholderiales bacterium]
MDFSPFTTALQNTLGSQLPSILAALAILVVGYIIALLARAGIRRLLSLIRLDQRVGEAAGRPVEIEAAVAAIVFWLVLLATLVGVLGSLRLDQLSEPFAAMLRQVMLYLPHLLAGLLLTLLAWVLAALVRAVANRALKATQWDEKLTAQAGTAPLADNVGNVLFWLVILLFLPAILGALKLEGLLDPIRAMVGEVLDVLPNVFAAAVIVFAGWLVARVVRSLLTNLLAATGLDRLGEAAGFKEEVKLSRLIGVLAYVLILLPVLIAALQTLDITAISQPASEMLSLILNAVPNILAAALILLITWFVARFAAGLVRQLLGNMGFNALPARLGVGQLLPEGVQAADLVAWLIVFFAMLFAAVEAAHRLDFTQVEGLVAMFIQFAGNVLLGVVILLVGFWLANLAHQAIVRASQGKAEGLASIARFAILGLVLAMGLSAMGIAEDIVNMAFAFVFGAVAVAIALSFGLGGREAAGRQMEHWLSKLRKEER